MPEDHKDKFKDHETRHRECERWRAEHDGRINAWWEAQHRWNADVESLIDRYEKRIHKMESSLHSGQQVSGVGLSRKQAAAATGGISAITLIASKLIEWLSSVTNSGA